MDSIDIPEVKINIQELDYKRFIWQRMDNIAFTFILLLSIIKFLISSFHLILEMYHLDHNLVFNIISEVFPISYIILLLISTLKKIKINITLFNLNYAFSICIYIFDTERIYFNLFGEIISLILALCILFDFYVDNFDIPDLKVYQITLRYIYIFIASNAYMLVILLKNTYLILYVIFYIGILLLMINNSLIKIIAYLTQLLCIIFVLIINSANIVDLLIQISISLYFFNDILFAKLLRIYA